MKYLAFYDIDENKSENRNIVLAATNKLKYILECFEESGIFCEVISASSTHAKKTCKKKRIQISKHISLELPFSLGKTNKIIGVLDRWQIKLGILIKLLKMKRDETLIVYHSAYYMPLVSLAKKIKDFRLVLEVEEIYGDVMENDKISEREIKFFNLADAYIFPTELLNKKINAKNKPYIIIYGTYRLENKISEKFNDGKTHIVYAGTFDRRKGGVAAAVAAGEFLSADYHIHILGFGTREDKEHLLHEIERVSKISKCKVTFDGLLSGEEYIKFIQSCHIGLSTQNPTAKFNDTSFPSKILSYMSNGLRVVSIRIPAIETSAIGEYMYYYEEQTSEKIAKAIQEVNLADNYDSRKRIEELDKKFKVEIKALL